MDGDFVDEVGHSQRQDSMGRRDHSGDEDLIMSQKERRWSKCQDLMEQDRWGVGR
jgi:hypothetical protein